MSDFYSTNNRSTIKDDPMSANSGRWRIFTSRVSLGVKLPLVVIVLLLVAYLISTILSVNATRTALIETLQNELTNQSLSSTELVRSNLIWTRSVAIDLAAAAEVNNYDEQTILNTIKNTLERNDQIFGSTIAYEPFQFKLDQFYWAPYYNRNPDNELQFTQLGTLEYNYLQKDWYTAAKQSGKPILSLPYYDFGGGNIWMVTWSVPFFDPITGDIKGVATADIAFSQTQEFVNNISVGVEGYAFMLDPRGIVLGVGGNGGEYEPMIDSMVTASFSNNARNWNTLVQEMLAGKTGFVDAVDPQGKPVFVAYAPVGMDTGWSLALAFPQAELLETPLRLQYSLILYSSIVAIIFGVILYLLTRSIINPIQELTTYANQFSAEHINEITKKSIEPIRLNTRDELEELASAFNVMSLNLKNAVETLEEKVQDRTKQLEKRSLEFETIAEVARDITIIRDLNTLLNVAVNLIRERFKFYHVGIFLVDDNSQYAYLRAASSVAAQQMLDLNYKLKVGEEGLVGNVTRTGRAHIAQDVGKDAIHFQNPYLPLTRSEIVLPLRNRSIIIGALDIQATVEAAFEERDIDILQLLADQLAAAIENAQLAQQVQGTFAELNNAYKQQTRTVWQSAISERGQVSYEYDGMQIQSVPRDLPEDLRRQLDNGKPIILTAEGSPARQTLLVPLMIRNQTIGVIGLEQENPNQAWTEEQIAVAEAAANRAGLTLENARLLEESQRRAVKERAIFESTTRIGSALNMENILQATAEELERVLGASEVVLQFINDRNS